MKIFLEAIWQFCSHLFVPQWGRKRDMEMKDGPYEPLKEEDVLKIDRKL